MSTTPLLRKTKPQTKTIKTWPEGALSHLQDCFSTTVWDLFSSHNLQEYTDSVLCYIKNCVGTVTVNKRVRAFPNQKSWMNSEVQSLLKSRNTAFKSGDRDRPSAATPLPPPSSTDTLTLQEHEVRRVLRTVSPRKEAGPDRVPDT